MNEILLMLQPRCPLESPGPDVPGPSLWSPAVDNKTLPYRGLRGKSAVLMGRPPTRASTVTRAVEDPL
jgi:hypothetical protein